RHPGGIRVEGFLPVVEAAVEEALVAAPPAAAARQEVGN
ncbi:MAG: hypothetical protein UX92_C0006G0047, partial [Candidatus Amesbacteria bacterium GW2011_GWA1_47_20]